MQTIFYTMRAVAMLLMLIALGMFLVNWNLDFDHPIHVAIGILVIGSEILNYKYHFDDTWKKKPVS